MTYPTNKEGVPLVIFQVAVKDHSPGMITFIFSFERNIDQEAFVLSIARRVAEQPAIKNNLPLPFAAALYRDWQKRLEKI